MEIQERTDFFQSTTMLVPLRPTEKNEDHCCHLIPNAMHIKLIGIKSVYPVRRRKILQMKKGNFTFIVTPEMY